MKRKKTAYITKALTVTALTALISAPALADKKQALQDAKSGATFLTAALAGGIAGGPIGFILGGLGGAYWAEQGQKALEQERELQSSYANLSILEQTMNQQDLEISRLEEMIEAKMQFQMYFKTGDTALTSTDETQLEALADFLTDNDYMHVSIDGHADPRGDQTYNLELSKDRAESVAQILQAAGIPDYRLQIKGHGASFSNTSLESIEEYAQQRRVKIQVFPSKASANLASTN